MNNKKFLAFGSSLIFLLGCNGAPMLYSSIDYEYSSFSVDSIVLDSTTSLYEVNITNNGNYVISEDTTYFNFLSKNQSDFNSLQVQGVKDNIYISKGMSGTLLFEDNEYSKILYDDFSNNYEMKYQCDAYNYYYTSISYNLYFESYDKDNDITKFKFKYYINNTDYDFKYITTSYYVDDVLYEFTFNVNLDMLKDENNTSSSDSVSSNVAILKPIEIKGLHFETDIDSISVKGYYKLSNYSTNDDSEPFIIGLIMFVGLIYGHIILYVLTFIVIGIILLIKYLNKNNKNKDKSKKIKVKKDKEDNKE